ncbi:MAG: tRNA (adenine-N1)-methyltransferase [Thermofilum sp.]|uniref:tRNA (Adenine-N1)-methyltransferase n=1 Tax=Thermofilum pendens TaxID=2269 RepID=A0A7C4D3D8_THEPE
MRRINAGEWVTLYYSEGETYTVRVDPEKVFHTTRGYVNLRDLVGAEPGSVIETNVGERFIVSRASFIDKLASLRRFTQVIYPKDLGYILLSTGVGPGSRVGEAGTGTGFLTATLAYYVRPDGKVYTYEVRRDFYEKALENFKALGLLPFIVAKNKDIKEGFDEQELDAVVLDLPDPWLVADKAYAALAHGGTLVVFVPTVPQVERSLHALRRAGFRRLEVIELMMRRYKTEPAELRPETIGVQHTGYIIQGQKL